MEDNIQKYSLTIMFRINFEERKLLIMSLSRVKLNLNTSEDMLG